MCLGVCICNLKHHTFCIFLIEHSMGMHGVAPGCKVLQMNHYNVINLSSKYGPQEAQPLRPGSKVSVRSIRILSEHSLLINTANEVRFFSQEYICMSEIEVGRRHKK